MKENRKKQSDKDKMIETLECHTLEHNLPLPLKALMVYINVCM